MKSLEWALIQYDEKRKLGHGPVVMGAVQIQEEAIHL